MPSMNTYKKYNSEVKNSTKDKTEFNGQKIFEQIKKSIEDSRFETEEEKKAYEDKLDKKIKLGKKLSIDDMEYIRKTNPTMYMHVMRAQMTREMTVNSLDNCKSKKEVQKVHISEIASIDEKDPDKEIMTAAVNDAVSEYKETDKYKALPEETKEEKNVGKKQEKENAQDMDCDIYQYKKSLVYAMITQANFDLEA
jgi:hypothetical protein